MKLIRAKNTGSFYLSGLHVYKEDDQRSWQNSAYKKASACYLASFQSTYMNKKYCCCIKKKNQTLKLSAFCNDG